jgi:hypothetical protein
VENSFRTFVTTTGTPSTSVTSRISPSSATVRVASTLPRRAEALTVSLPRR